MTFPQFQQLNPELQIGDVEQEVLQWLYYHRIKMKLFAVLPSDLHLSNEEKKKAIEKKARSQKETDTSSDSSVQIEPDSEPEYFQPDSEDATCIFCSCKFSEDSKGECGPIVIVQVQRTQPIYVIIVKPSEFNLWNYILYLCVNEPFIFNTLL